MYLEIKNSSNQLISRIYNKTSKAGAVYWIEVELDSNITDGKVYVGINNNSQKRTIYFPIGISLYDKSYSYTLFTANDELTIPYYQYVPNYTYSGSTAETKTSNNVPTLSPKKFTGWKRGSTTYYAAGSINVKNYISVAGTVKPITLTAQWSNVTSGRPYTTTWVGATSTTNNAGSQFETLPGSGCRIDEYSRQIYADSYSLGPSHINSVDITNATTFPNTKVASYSGSVPTTTPSGQTVSWILDLYDLGKHDNSIDLGYSFKAKYSGTDGYNTYVGSSFSLLFYSDSNRSTKIASKEYSSNSAYHYNLRENGVYKYVGFLASTNSKQNFAPLSEEYALHAADYNVHLLSKFTGSEGVITIPYPAADPTTGKASLTIYPSIQWIKDERGAQPRFTINANDLVSFTVEALDYSVKYDKNTSDAVSNMPANGVKQYNVAYTISDLIPVREGYKFRGWNLGTGEPTDDFPGIPMQPGDVIPASNNDGHYILYAQWKKEEWDYDSEKAGEPITFLVHMKPQVLISAKRYSLEEPDRVVLVQKPSFLESLPDANGKEKNFVSSTYRVKYRREPENKADRNVWTSSATTCYEDRTPYSTPSYPNWQTVEDEENSPILTQANGLFRSDLKSDSARTNDIVCGIDDEWQFQSRIYDALGPSSTLTYKEGTKQLSSSDKYNTLSDWSNIALLLKYVTKLLVHNPLVDEVLKETRNNKNHREGSNPPETDFWQIRDHTQNSGNSLEEIIGSLLDIRGKAPDEENMIGGSINGFTKQQIKNYIIPTLLRELRENERLVYDPSQITPLIKMLYQINSDHDKINQEYTELTEQENYSGLDVGDMTSAGKLDNSVNNGRLLELDGERHQTDTNWKTESDTLENRVLDTDFQKVELANFENEQVEDDAQSTIDHISNYDISQLDLKTSLSDLLYILSRMTQRGVDDQINVDGKSEDIKEPSGLCEVPVAGRSQKQITVIKSDGTQEQKIVYYSSLNDISKDTENMANYWDFTNNRFKDSAFTNWIPSTGKWKTPENNLSEYDNPIEDYSVLVNTDSLDKNNSYGDNDFLNNGCRATCMGLCTTGCYQTCVGGCKTACGDSCFFGCKTSCTGSCGTGCANSCSGECEGGCKGTCKTGCKNGCKTSCSGGCTGCTASCKVSCDNVCEAKCVRSCNSTCTDSCTAACKNGCDSDCTTSCGYNCSGSCKGGCKASCTGGCNKACGNNCNKGCNKGCGGTCGGNCSTTCDGGCSGGCNKECKGTCISKCVNSCGGTCSRECTKVCSSGCEEGCSGQCYYGCNKTCRFTCKDGCTGGCSTTCAKVCASGCATGCTSNCSKSCQYGCTSCGGECSGGCYGQCAATCNNSCYNVCSGECRLTCNSLCAGTCTTYCNKDSCKFFCDKLCYSACQDICRGTCKSECLSGCQKNCYGGCAQACTESCRNDCKNGCKENCGNTCNSSCGGSCVETCGQGCGDTCYTNCGGLCNNSCGSNCKGTCLDDCNNNCSGKCKSSCSGSCISLCGGSCSGKCTGTCTGTCGYNCYSACEAACSNTCGSGCSNGCISSCKGTCGRSCSNNCGISCNSDCQGGCSSGCKTGCKSNCVTSCSSDCSEGCQGSCEGGCSTTCTGTCIGSCTDACTGCTGTCFSSCGLTCGGSCSATCAESCVSSCTGSAYKLSA